MKSTTAPWWQPLLGAAVGATLFVVLLVAGLFAFMSQVWIPLVGLGLTLLVIGAIAASAKLRTFGALCLTFSVLSLAVGGAILLGCWTPSL